MGENIKNGVHGCSSVREYIKPRNESVLKALEEFQDKKLGFMMHWAPVCQLGIYESWCLCDDADSWSAHEIPWVDDKDKFREDYKKLPKTFNPIAFNPYEWAKLAKDCGFKYVLFTTKHHDGFCMWDTKTTDYKITNKDYPFSTHKYANVCKHVFDAFRNEGLGVHAYFSKPDWYSEYYWAPEFKKPGDKTTPNTNYVVKDHPEVWNKFVEYTHNQIREIMSNYGKIDVLWLDGGCVNPNINNQDVKIGEIVEEIRSTTQPHLLSADRTVGGEYENFITPEQSLPDEPIFVPWESCITVGDRFSFHYTQKYKTPRQIVHMLIDIVAKGGNLALNITPQPNGMLPAQGIKVIKELGQFLKVNGEGIYGTRVCAPYVKDKFSFTKKNDHIYAFYSCDENEEIEEKFNIPIEFKAKSVIYLGNNKKLSFKVKQGSLEVDLPRESIENNTQYAIAFKIC